MKRLMELDTFRGLLLLIMVINHTPSPIRELTTQPLGFVSAAEAFVMVSACLCGLIFSRKLKIGGLLEMKRLARRRILKIYLSHLLTLLFCFAVIGQLLGYYLPFHNMVHSYLQQPINATISALLLLYQPPLLDVLPMYIIFLLLTPFLMEASARVGWLPLITGSLLLWLAAQYGLKEWMVGTLSGWLVIDLGAFNLFSWQLLWVGGLLLGHRLQQGSEYAALTLDKIPWPVLASLALFFFCWRWPWIPVSIDLGANDWLLDKWQLGPLRLLNFLALMYLVFKFGPYLSRAMDWLQPLATMGRNILPLFSLHVCVSLLAVGFIELYEITSGWCYLILTLHLILILGLSLLLDRFSSTPPGNSAAAPSLRS